MTKGKLRTAVGTYLMNVLGTTLNLSSLTSW